MNDEVNNPSHYNQNGIEVIDVIETYAKHDFRLANVIKYVCRSAYKGKELEDLQKAEWYLKRAINDRAEAEVEAALKDESWRVAERDNSEWTRAGLAWAADERDNDYPADATYESATLHPSPDRIAGDDDAAKRIKDEYYRFDRFESKGYCAQCDAEIGATQPHVTSGIFEANVIFCKLECMDALKTWQGR